MEGDQLRLLEERINKAITFIENLKSREKALIEEREGVKRRVSSLEDAIRERELKIDALKENQLFLKDKIESILSKLESLASLDAETASFMTEQEEAFEGGRFQGEEAVPDEGADEMVEDISQDEEIAESKLQENEADEAMEEQGAEKGAIIVEENIVDLEGEEGDSEISELEDEGKRDTRAEREERGKRTTWESGLHDSENTLFDSEET